jgi:hypothetical protein
MTDFTRVLLTDKIAWQLFGLAAREQMLYTSAGEDPPIPRRGALSQHALSLSSHRSMSTTRRSILR